jgi:hypothetical protein
LPVLNAHNMGRELLHALVVLALIFLSFAHAPVSVAASGPDTLTAALDMSYCGDTPDNPKAHAPCHACRIGGGADLPPPCDIAVAMVIVADVAYGALPALHLPAEPLGTATARGPPASV